MNQEKKTERHLLLKEIGTEIDQGDKSILSLIAGRSLNVARVGLIKSELDMPIYRPEVEEARQKAWKEYAKNYDVRESLAMAIWHLLTDDACKQQLIEREKKEEQAKRLAKKTKKK